MELDPEQSKKVEDYLDLQGLTLRPLREEMKDHLLQDLAVRVEAGASLGQAWEQITGQIPDNHFKSIQIEVMETIDKKFSLSRAFTYLSLVLIVILVIFKLLHLSLSGILLLAAFGAMGASLFIGTVFSLYPFKNKKESLLLLGAVIGIELLLLSFFTQIKHLPGFFALRTSAVIILLVFFPLITVYMGTRGRSEDQILSFIHKNHSPGIERFFLITLSIATVLRFISITFESIPDVSHVLLALTVGGAGFQFFALNWHYSSKPPWGLQVALIVAFAIFILPTLNFSRGNPIFSINTVVLFTTSFYLITGAVLLYRSQQLELNDLLKALVLMTSLIYLGWGLSTLGVINTAINPIIFNIPVLVLLMIGLIISFKQPLAKIFMIMVIAQYMFEYPIQLGIW